LSVSLKVPAWADEVKKKAIIGKIGMKFLIAELIFICEIERVLTRLHNKSQLFILANNVIN